MLNKNHGNRHTCFVLHLRGNAFGISRLRRMLAVGLSQFSSVSQLCLTLCNPMDCSTPGFPVHHQLPELTQTHVHRVGDIIQPSCPLSSLSPPAFNLSQHQHLFHWVNSSHKMPKCWSFSFSISPSNEYSGLFSFRIDWVWFPCNPKDSQESSPTQQFKSINSSAPSCLYSPTLTSIHDYWKTIVFTKQTFVDQIVSLLFNMLSRLVIALHPRNKRLLISWLQSPSAVILETKKLKSVTVSIVFPSICHKWWERMPWSLLFERWVLSQLFHSPLSLSSKDSLFALCFLP